MSYVMIHGKSLAGGGTTAGGGTAAGVGGAPFFPRASARGPGARLAGLGANTAPDSRVPTPWDNEIGRAKEGSPYVVEAVRPGDARPETGMFRPGGAFRQVGNGNNRGWGLGGLAGLGAAPINDTEARQRLLRVFLDTTAECAALINQALVEMPAVILQGTKDRLKVARDRINQAVPGFPRSVNSVGADVINDTSIPLDEVESRVTSFLTEFANITAQQIELAQQTAKSVTLRNLIVEFRDAARTVVRATLREVLDTGASVTSGMPWWVYVGGALLGGAYVVRAFR